MMDNVNLMVTSNCINSRSLVESYIEKKSYSKAGFTRTIAFMVFAGATVLKMPSSEEIVLNNDFATSPYIQYINLNKETRCEDLCTNRALDLMKIENINKIRKMALFEENWNGTNGRAFSQNAIRLFEIVINSLDKQPQIAPTGRNSLLLQYELEDKSMLAFEVCETRTEKVLIPKGDYKLAEMEVYTENICQKIKESVEFFYGFR